MLDYLDSTCGERPFRPALCLLEKNQKMTFNVSKHQLVSKHIKISDSEKEALFKKYNITIKSLPKILKDDVAIAHLNVNAGDIIKIERESKTTGTTAYYRGVIDG